MKPTHIFLHHVGYNHSVYTVNKGHKDKGYPKSSLGWYVGYHYYIRNGKLWKTRKEDEVGMHNRGYNEKAVAIGFDKNHETTPLSNQDQKLATPLMKGIQKRWNIPNENIKGHCDTDNTVCPGKYVMSFLEEYKYSPVSIAPEKPTENVIQPSKGRLTAIQRAINVIRQKIKNLLKSLNL